MRDTEILQKAIEVLGKYNEYDEHNNIIQSYEYLIIGIENAIKEISEKGVDKIKKL